MEKTTKIVSEKGLEIFNKFEKDGTIIKCQKCENDSFKILVGFLEPYEDKIYPKDTKDNLISVSIVMCNECLCFNIQRKIL